MQWFVVGALMAAIYCVARSIADLRVKRYVWGIAGPFERSSAPPGSCPNSRD
jgi:hypothetical protein